MGCVPPAGVRLAPACSRTCRRSTLDQGPAGTFGCRRFSDRAPPRANARVRASRLLYYVPHHDAPNVPAVIHRSALLLLATCCHVARCSTPISAVADISLSIAIAAAPCVNVLNLRTERGFGMWEAGGSPGSSTAGVRGTSGAKRQHWCRDPPSPRLPYDVCRPTARPKVMQL